MKIQDPRSARAHRTKRAPEWKKGKRRAMTTAAPGSARPPMGMKMGEVYGERAQSLVLKHVLLIKETTVTLQTHLNRDQGQHPPRNSGTCPKCGRAGTPPSTGHSLANSDTGLCPRFCCVRDYHQGSWQRANGLM